MATACLHDGSTLDVTIDGHGPAVLLPVSTAVVEGEAAEQMRAWGADPALGGTLVKTLAGQDFRVIAADYEGHRARHPAPHTLDAAAVCADLLAIADAAGADRFAYYGYSWLALAGLQLAARSDRLTALAMGGFPPLGGPYESMLTVTRAALRMALENVGKPPDPAEIEPGDWDSAEVTQDPDQMHQYVTLYESLQGFDERGLLRQLSLPRLAFAGAEDNITYGPKWDNAYVPIGGPLWTHQAELAAQGWTVVVIPDADHVLAMQAATVLPILAPWLTANLG
jgi:pimeloyl-ACP methyl ester carboxylesterase